MSKWPFVPVLSFGVFLVATGHTQNPPSQIHTQREQGSPQVGLAPPAKHPAKVMGRVLRAEDGRPLSKATLTLFADGRPAEPFSARTLADGVFEFAEVPPGRYRLRAERTGYVAEVYGARGGGPGIPLVLEPGQQVNRIEFRLQRAGVISGTVTDEDQEPVEGVTVRAERIRFSPGGHQQTVSARTTRTDDLGSFRLYGLAPGSYYVKAGGREGVSIGGVAAVGYTAAYYPGVAIPEEASRVQVTAGAETRRVDVSVRAGKTYTVSGVIVDATPAAGRKNYSIGFASGNSLAIRSLEPQEGSFTLRGIEPGEYTLVAMVSRDAGPLDSPGRRGYRSVKVVDSDVSVTIEVGRSAEVRGEVRVEEAGEFSLRGLSVRLRPESENGVSGTGTVEEDGTFRVTDVPEGNYVFELQGREDEVYLKEARCAGEDRVVQPLALVADQVVDRCELTLARDVARVDGVVLGKEEHPVRGAVVVLIPRDPVRRQIPRHTATAQTDASGQFSLRGVISGDYFAFATMPTEDAAYYDLEFPNRNRDKAEAITVEPSEAHTLGLKLLAQPR